ncbi:MAG: hypothetical protein IRZ26_02080 [Clostridia bacterium]|nr:hypothetical protein [Clostridia bacterium]
MNKKSAPVQAGRLQGSACIVPETAREDAALLRRLAGDDRPLDPLGWDAWVWLRALFRHSDLPSDVVLVLVQGQLLLVHGETMPWPRLRNLAERVAALLEAEGRRAA